MADDFLRSAVGRGAPNRREDVRVVQTLLNRAGANPPLAVDGRFGAHTDTALAAYQAPFLSVPDGVVSPGGPTLRHLLGAPALAPERPPLLSEGWSGPSEQWPEAKKLASLTPVMRPLVQGVLADLRGQGFDAKIFFAWRSIAVQAGLVRRGNSTVTFSFHNAQNRDGTPNACAVDIIDRRWAWGAGADANGFWPALGAAGKACGLYWGGDWKSFQDVAHLQLFPNTELPRVKHESGF